MVTATGESKVTGHLFVSCHLRSHNPFEVIRVLQEHEGVQTEVRFKRRPAEPAMAR
jgi:hypothetical protein